jgi:hypothetical protein
MTYDEAKPFTEKLYELAMWYHAKPNEFKRRAYDVVDDIAQAEREACAKVCDYMANRCDDIRKPALEVAAENIRTRGNT